MSAVVPARNEERTIGACVRALLSQEGLPELEVIVVDDESSDATPRIAADLAAADSRVVRVEGAPMPAGWIGKSWALSQGAHLARHPWLLFVDADTIVGPRAVASALASALDGGHDAFSMAPRLELGSFWERAVLPQIFATFPFAFGSPAEINDPRRTDRAFLFGPFILISRTAYDGVGGHASVASEMSEDLELGVRVKRDGRFSLWFGDGRALASIRPYRSLREIWLGYTKNSVTGARGSAVKILLAALLALSLSAWPLWLFARAASGGRLVDALEAAASTAAVLGATAANLSKLGMPVRYALLQPIGFVVMAAIALNSLASVVSGRGVEWRGRRYTGRYRGTEP